MSRVKLTIGLAVAAAVAMTGTANAVVNGQTATERYEFMASIPMSVPELNGAKGVCGGSLIDSRWVVTAAHCVDTAGTGSLPDGVVRVGSTKRSSGGAVRAIDRVVIHPGYQLGRPNRHDLALIRLDRPVPQRPIRIADAARPGTPTRLLGFGTTFDTVDITRAVWPERLRQLDSRIGTAQECAPGYADAHRLCTVSRKPRAMACIGDSGGPQLQRGPGRWELVGVTSGPGDTDAICANGPGLYSNLPAHTGWIRATIG